MAFVVLVATKYHYENVFARNYLYQPNQLSKFYYTILTLYIYVNVAASQNDLEPNIAVLFGAPLITPNTRDVTLELGTNFSINCASKHPITWKPFQVKNI